jgi:hypothetical protein
VVTTAVARAGRRWRSATARPLVFRTARLSELVAWIVDHLLAAVSALMVDTADEGGDLVFQGLCK